MVIDITQRQEKLLLAIIKEFIDSAEAVGSLTLQTKYKLNVSPATIRNEMAALTKKGYLEQPHASAGRVPTTLGFKKFLEELDQDLEEMDSSIEAVIHEDLFQSRFDLDQLIYHALSYLTEEIGAVAFAIAETEFIMPTSKCLLFLISGR
jgi:heat-inducible transcriptional repressor